MYIPSFKMPTIRQVWDLIQQGCIDLKDAYLDIPIVKHHHYFYCLFGNTNLFSEMSCHLGLAQPEGFHCTY